MSVLFRNAPAPERRNFMDAQDVLRASRSLRTGTIARYTTRDALEIAAVVSCVGLRAGAFAQLPIKGYLDDVSGLPVFKSPQPDLLRSPSDVVVPSVWKTQMSISRDLWGFALGKITAFDAAFYAKRVEWIDPSIVDPKIVGATVEWRVDREYIDPSLLLHIPSRWVLPGNPVGICPLEYSGLVDLAKRAQDFGRDWFRNGAVPSSIVYSDRELNAEQAEGILNRITDRWRNRQPALLDNRLKYEKISVAANESQFLETCNKVAHDIAISYNLPPSKVGAAMSGADISYGNRDQDQQQYLIDSINPDLVVVEESLDRHSPRGQYCKFKTGAFLRSDLKTRYESYKLGIEAQFILPNEVRALEELAPIPGGDAFPKKSAPPAPSAREAT
jgi:HK97 family phage portal protein